jgi:hypothetical protein
MRTISILPEKPDSYRALAGDKESTGRTAGEALDALSAQLADEEAGTLVVVQNHKADEFFSAAQQERLTELMRLRAAGSLAADEALELESLVEAELHAARQRAETISAAKRFASEALRISKSLLPSTSPASEKSEKV